MRKRIFFLFLLFFPDVPFDCQRETRVTPMTPLHECGYDPRALHVRHPSRAPGKERTERKEIQVCETKRKTRFRGSGREWDRKGRKSPSVRQGLRRR
jgi:hypothetical protein